MQDQVDWRRVQLNNVLTYSLDSFFPNYLAKSCLDMVKEFGLCYGAFDFIKNDDGYFFLEINPNGQWGFLENETGVSISSSIARLINSKM